MWGFLHGPERGLFEFRFDLPAQCADALGAGEADMGLVPCAELDRLGLGFLPDLGIACEGPVRSILLVSKVPFGEIRTLAVDSGSRTSVALARILLAERYGCQPAITRACASAGGDAGGVRRSADHRGSGAAILIRSAALATLDLGAEWVAWSGLPMVFAVWAGRTEVLTAQVATAFQASWEWGRGHMDEIVVRAAAERGFRGGYWRGNM